MTRLSEGWFGESWGGPACEEETHCPTPVGRACLHCEEGIADGDQGIINGQGYVWHLDCHLRGIIGGYNHLQGNCMCCGGTESPDPEGLTRRTAATLAVQTWERANNVCPRDFILLAAGKAIQCLHCTWVSWNPKDVENRYCGKCHRSYP